MLGDAHAGTGHDQRGAVETLKVPARSPPVPHVSKTSPDVLRQRTACARIVVARPTISSGRSPFIDEPDEQAGQLGRRGLARP